MTNHIQLSAPEAQFLTDRAVTLADELARTLVAIHDGNGHKALGYSSFKAYCDVHFDTPLRTIYRMIRKERVRAVLDGHANLARFTEEALDILGGDETYAYIETIANIAGNSTDGKINGQVIKAVKGAILNTVITGAVELADGSQVSVKEAMADGVRGVLREDVLSKREYIVAGINAKCDWRRYGGVIYLEVNIGEDSEPLVPKLDEIRFKDVRISIWREQ